MMKENIEQKIDRRLLFLSGLFATLLITSNLMAVKLISIFGIILPSAVLLYPFCFTVNDLINEYYGFSTAKKIIWFAFLFNGIVVVFTMLAAILTPAPIYMDNESFRAIFLSTPRVLGASFAAFIISGILNSFVFSKIKERNSYLALRSAVSTFLGIITDSTLFITLAFIFTVPLTVLVFMIIWQALAKIVIGIGLGTPMTLVIVKKYHTAAQRHSEEENKKDI